MDMNTQKTFALLVGGDQVISDALKETVFKKNDTHLHACFSVF